MTPALRGGSRVPPAVLRALAADVHLRHEPVTRSREPSLAHCGPMPNRHNGWAGPHVRLSMRMQVLVRNRVLTTVVFAAALALAMIAALQAHRTLLAPTMPVMEPRLQPSNVETSASPAAPSTAAPRVAPFESDTAPAIPASEVGERPNTTNTTAPAVPAGVPASTTLPAAQPKAAPADGRPMGDHNLQPPSTRAWKGGFDY